MTALGHARRGKPVATVCVPRVIYYMFYNHIFTVTLHPQRRLADYHLFPESTKVRVTIHNTYFSVRVYTIHANLRSPLRGAEE